jgi:quinol monooxygenase YgiN
MSDTTSSSLTAATKATLVPVRALPGQRDKLAELLLVGRDIVAQSEPNTLYWVALQSEADPDEFAIFDLFPNADGRAEHFGGQVAAALKARADELVVGGWEKGVLARVVHFDARAATARG